LWTNKKGALAHIRVHGLSSGSERRDRWNTTAPAFSTSINTHNNTNRMV
jgi:hypothetical protein